MRNKFIKILLLLFLASSCSQEKPVPVSIKPIHLDINGDIQQLQEQLKKRNTMLVYENSYEGEAKGIKLFYFDDENDSMHYHLEVYVIDNKIKGFEAGISSKQLDKDRLYSKIEKEILPNFKNTTKELSYATVKAERNNSDSLGYYSFKIKTQELKNKESVN